MEKKIVVFALGLMVVFIASGVGARTLWVPDQYDKIQDAINAASYADTVMVRAGTYSRSTNGESFPIVMRNGVRLISEKGPGVTVLDAEGLAKVITLLSCDRTTHIRGFAIQNGGTGWAGGAIYCASSNPVIGNDIFRDNGVSQELDARGGAIYCWHSQPIIIGNSFLSNHAEGRIFEDSESSAEGGAVSLFECDSAVISWNLFAFNWVSASNSLWGAYAYGGGVDIQSSYVTMSNNTFYQNSASATDASFGGAIHGYYITGEIRNSVFWDDAADSGSEMFLRPGSATVTYSDVDGGWSGIGDINRLPYFINPAAGVFDLQRSSPCVDAGDPASLLDPDGTRADMGAFYFDQSVTPSVELYPHDQPIVIPASGDTVSYDGWVYNLTDTSIVVDIWTRVRLPGGNWFGPIRQHSGMSIRPHARIGMNNISDFVPAYAPAGVYTYVGYVGRFQSTVLDSSYFLFTKSQ